MNLFLHFFFERKSFMQTSYDINENRAGFIDAEEWTLCIFIVQLLERWKSFPVTSFFTY